MFESTIKNDVCIMVLPEQVTITETQKFQSAINEQVDKERRAIALDFSTTSFIDSSGIGMFIKCHRFTEQSDVHLWFVNATEPIIRIFDSLRLVEPYVFLNEAQLAAKLQ